MKKFTAGITKEEISRMPREVFEGKIFVVDSEEKLKEAIAYLLTCKEIGFDTETRPNFSKKTHYKMALMQLSSDDKCFLIRLNKFDKMPVMLEEFLKNDSVKKIGLSLRDDFQGLHVVTTITPENFIDLQKYVVQFGVEDMSLQKIYAIMFAKRISKRERLSNWENTDLTDKQKIYAAIDAWACLKIYKFLEMCKSQK
ncbi:MAG: 3'-5' exonuclease domain-containing protein 2 [Tannerella sp.]|jgi:ribonuclease D|nr:3'-5' exonuclease domain-containing protein 2 [Tannerella sp.]